MLLFEILEIKSNSQHLIKHLNESSPGVLVQPQSSNPAEYLYTDTTTVIHHNTSYFINKVHDVF